MDRHDRYSLHTLAPKHEILKGELSKVKKDFEENRRDLFEARCEEDEALRMQVSKLSEVHDKYPFNIVEFNKVLRNIQTRTNYDKYEEINFESTDRRDFKRLLKSGKARRFPDSFKLGKLIPGKLCMIGALPKTGKTSFACSMTHWNELQEYRTLFLSIEMEPLEIWLKLFMIEVYREHKKSIDFEMLYDIFTDPNHIKHEITVKKYNQYRDSIKYTEVLDAGAFTVDDIEHAIDHSMKIFGQYPDFVMVDYVQLISVPQFKDFRQKMLHAAAELAGKAKRTGCSIIALSQLNKDGNYKESGSFEENSALNIVLEQDEEAPGMLIINVKSSRFTGAPKSNVDFDRRSGAMG